MKTVLYSRVGENRGLLRIFLDGMRLAATGVKPGDRFSIESGSRSIKMVFSDDGSHAVCKRSRNGRELPVIDVRGKQVEQAFKADDRVRVVVKDGQIEVTLHHQARSAIAREERLQERVDRNQPLLIGSMAHGGGVLDHAIHTGLAEAGVQSKLAFANELEAEYLETSMANNPVWSADSVAIQGPMQEVEWQLLPKVDLLVAGLPCTGASLSGRAKNGLKAAEEHEGAGALFVSFLQAISTLKPSVVVLENVPQYLGTTSFTVIKAVLEQLDYRVQDTILGGAEFGAIEDRQRMCMVASSKGVVFPELSALPRPVVQPRVLGDVLEQVPLDHEMWRACTYLKEKAVRDKASGKNFKMQIVTPQARTVGCAGKSYWKYRSTEPMLAHPSGDGRIRLFTPLEHARIKTIPPELVAGCSNTIAHEILGQSVIHAAFKAVGQWIGQALLELRAQRALPIAA